MARACYDFADKLIRSLSPSYEVIDRPMVLECIAFFEHENVTKHFLEETRLGKYVNELRRRTKDESLAKRTRELVRKWRHRLIGDKSSTSTLPTAAAAAAAAAAMPSSSTTQTVDQNNLKVTNNNNLIYVNNNNKRPFNDETKAVVVPAKKPRRNGKLKGSDSSFVATAAATAANNDCDDVMIISDNSVHVSNTNVCLPPRPSSLSPSLPPQLNTTTASASTSVADALPAIVASLAKPNRTLTADDEIERVRQAEQQQQSQQQQQLSPPPQPPPLSQPQPPQPIPSIIIVDDDDDDDGGGGGGGGDNENAAAVGRSNTRRHRSRGSRAKNSQTTANDSLSKLLAAANKKCKTTEEIVGQLNNRSILQTSEIKKMDPPVAIEKLRKEIEKIDAQLNPAIQKSVNEIPKWRPKKNGLPTVIEIESDEDDDADDADDADNDGGNKDVVLLTTEQQQQPEPAPVWQMPPVDHAQFEKDMRSERKYNCGCTDANTKPICRVGRLLNKKYNWPHKINEQKVCDLHRTNMANVNGNWGVYVQPIIDMFPQFEHLIRSPPNFNNNANANAKETDSGHGSNVYDNIVPDLHTERLPKHGSDGNGNGAGDNNRSGQHQNESSLNVPLSPTYQSERDPDESDEREDDDDDDADADADNATAEPPLRATATSLFPKSRHTAKMGFAEFHECVDLPSYNDELLRVLPYTIID